MSSPVVRRALVLGFSLALLVSGLAFADTIVADGDTVDGDQASVDLGDVSPGATVPVDVAFHLTCKGSSHVGGGTAVTVSVADQSWPEDGTATSTSASIDVPADWPAPGDFCPDSGLPTTTSATPAHIVLTAPTLLGSGFEFTFLFAADPEDGVTNTIAFTALMNVVEDEPVDTTDPVLAGVPDNMTVFTAGTSAAASWATPTATDDTDPDPDVVCAPDSGSTFPLGTTTVTCTATDASGNSDETTFTVTVVQLVAGFAKPLEATVPALTGNRGRTIPLKLTVVVGGAVQGPSDIAPPTLRLERLAGCTADAAALETRAGGSFAWNDTVWQLNLQTATMATGCWRLSALSGDAAVTTAVIRLTPELTPARGKASASRHRDLVGRARRHRRG